MNILKDKRAQLDLVDMEILRSVGFIILAGMAISATLLGYIMGKQMGWGAFPIWQIIVIMIAEVIAAYVIVARNQ